MIAVGSSAVVGSRSFCFILRYFDCAPLASFFGDLTDSYKKTKRYQREINIKNKVEHHKN
jgi:hypothetical protein